MLVSPYSLESVARFGLSTARLEMILTKAVHVRIEPINDLISGLFLYPMTLNEVKESSDRVWHGNDTNIS